MSRELMVKAATQVDTPPKMYLDDVNFAFLLKSAGINGLKGLLTHILYASNLYEHLFFM